MIPENEIIKVVQDEVEFFTIKATGESGMSISGLGRLCGVGHDTISKLLDRLVTSSCPESLKLLQGKELTLVTSLVGFNNATVIKSEVCATVLEWYAFDSQRTNDTAKFSYRKFARIGIEAWIQQITGWQAKPLSPAEILMHQAQIMLKIEKEQELIKQQMALEAQRVSELEKVVEQHDHELDRIFKPDGEYYTVRGYASKIGFKNLTLAKAQTIGTEASKYCRERSIPTDRMKDPRYGTVKCYPEKVLELFF